MNDNIKDIRLGKGLGVLVFGNSRDQVKKILGEPADVERYSLSEFDEDETEAWHYDEKLLSLSFDQECEWKLSSIAVSAADYTLDGVSLIDRSKEEVLAEFAKNKWGEPVEDEEISRDDPGNALYHIEEAGMSLWFEDDVLTEIQIGPFIENDEVVWPQSN